MGDRKYQRTRPADSVRERLMLWPRSSGRVANHVRRQLKNMGRAPIISRVGYREAGKTSMRKRKCVAFVRRRTSRGMSPRYVDVDIRPEPTRSRRI